MISMDLALLIASRLREIEHSEAMLAYLKDNATKQKEEARSAPFNDPLAGRFKDQFDFEGRIELSIPTGGPDGLQSKKCYRVSPGLAASALRAHLAQMQADLVELNERAAQAAKAEKAREAEHV